MILEGSPDPGLEPGRPPFALSDALAPSLHSRRASPSWPGRPADPLEADAFEADLHREEARAYRTGRPLSLVLFSEPDCAAARPELLRTLADRARATDTTGLTHDGRVATLLPETEAEGARTFADAILGRLADDNLRLRCTVYSHAFLAGAAGDGADRERPGAAVDARDEHLAALVAEWPPGGRAAARPCGDLAELTSHRLPRWRRAMDIVVSGFALVLLSPLFLLTALAVRFTSPGPVFFMQSRAGRAGRPFAFYKFRSMYVDAEAHKEELRARNEASGPIFKIQADPRITPLGRILRRTSIDELPQLWNVFKGDMTLVGPRPPTFDEIPSYEPWQLRRLTAPVGLICIREVSGRSRVGFREWVRSDLRYIDRRSLWLDLRLLCRAVGAVLSRRGAC